MIMKVTNRIGLSVLLTISGFVFLSGAAEGAGTSRECLSYSPTAVTLFGTIVRRTFTNEATGAKEKMWVLRLEKPVCVDAGAENEFDVRRAGVVDMQLALEPEMYSRYRHLLRKRVKVKGVLFGQHTAHHFTAVLLDVDEIRARGR